ncbi:hypothetical protein BDZ89DRAFT_1055507, partial [Hymenopellis radicata]
MTTQGSTIVVPAALTIVRRPLGCGSGSWLWAGLAAAVVFAMAAADHDDYNDYMTPKRMTTTRQGGEDVEDEEEEEEDIRMMTTATTATITPVTPTTAPTTLTPARFAKLWSAAQWSELKAALTDLSRLDKIEAVRAFDWVAAGGVVTEFAHIANREKWRVLFQEAFVNAMETHDCSVRTMYGQPSHAEIAEENPGDMPGIQAYSRYEADIITSTLGRSVLLGRSYHSGVIDLWRASFKHLNDVGCNTALKALAKMRMAEAKIVS